MVSPVKSEEVNPMRTAMGYLANRYESRPRLPRKTVCESKRYVKPPLLSPQIPSCREERRIQSRVESGKATSPKARHTSPLGIKPHILRLCSEEGSTRKSIYLALSEYRRDKVCLIAPIIGGLPALLGRSHRGCIRTAIMNTSVTYVR